jgi:uncharacterized damage-inducible protein DinB
VATSLQRIFEGWDGYNTSLVKAVESLTPEQLAFRATPDTRSVGELAAHIAFGRVVWFERMPAPGSKELWEKWGLLRDERCDLKDMSKSVDASFLVGLLEESWQMVQRTLHEWTVDDLWKSYDHPYDGKTYAVSRQWTIWRIMCHDIQHGGQLTILLRMQGISPFELSELGGHLTEPPVAE